MKTLFFVAAVFLSSTVTASAQWVAIAAGDGFVASASAATARAARSSVLKKCPGCAWAVSKATSHLAIVRCPYDAKGDTYGWGSWSKKSVEDARAKALRKYKSAASQNGYILRVSQCNVPIEYTNGKFIKK